MPTRTRSSVATLSVEPVRIEVGDMTELKNALLVFEYSIKSVNKFYKIYQKERRGSSGTTTHEEQDLLRAMLVFSCSGLDAVIKQLIKDALPEVIKRDVGAQGEFHKYVDRRLRKSTNDEKEKIISIDTELLAQILISQNPQVLLAGRLTRHLTDDSLQNRDQLLKVAAYFAITSSEVLNDSENTKKAFESRNEIIHEMDVNLQSSPRSGERKRHPRSKEIMVKYSQNVLNIAARFLNVVYKKLKQESL